MVAIRVALALLAMLASSSLVSAQFRVELDVDGFIGEGPDTLDVDVGTLVAVDVWWVCDEPRELLFMETVICDSGGGLEYASYEYQLDQCQPGIATWTPQFPEPNCVLLRSQYLESAKQMMWCMTPVLQATLVYRAADDRGIQRLSVDEGHSMCVDSGFDTYYAEGSIGAVIRVGEETSITGTRWGTVKQLFR
jgi:hypothetical protein